MEKLWLNDIKLTIKLSKFSNTIEMATPDYQKDRHRFLMKMVSQLRELGYSKRWDVHKLGKKEVHRLVNRCLKLGNTHRTIANKMVFVRWLAGKLGRRDQIPKNKDLGIGLRKNDLNYGCNKATLLLKEHLDKLNPRMRLINELKFKFGLREEEACKFQYDYATKKSDKYIRLKGSWCKGGRPRVIEVMDDEQRNLLARIEVHQLEHDEKSLIPKGQKFRTYRNQVQTKSTSLGINGHGLRHHWAQAKFFELSRGIKAPLAGGPSYSSLNAEQCARWDKAARRVNEELGHGKGRKDTTATYIGVK